MHAKRGGGMNEWLLSIIGIIFISFALQIILPKGRTKKTVLFVFSLISVAVIVSPLAKISNNGDGAASNVFLPSAEDYYIEFTNNCRVDYCKTLAKVRLSQKGIGLNDAQFVLEEKNGELFVNQIKIKYSDLVIKNGDANINIEQVTVNELCALFDITMTQVVFYGK